MWTYKDSWFLYAVWDKEYLLVQIYNRHSNNQYYLLVTHDPYGLLKWIVYPCN